MSVIEKVSKESSPDFAWNLNEFQMNRFAFPQGNIRKRKIKEKLQETVIMINMYL